MRAILESEWLWLFLLGLILLLPVPSKAELKTFYHSGNMNRSYRDFQWEAEHFDAFVGNWLPIYYDTLKLYNPNIRIYNYLLAISCPKGEEMWDSLTAFFGNPPDSALVHYKFDILSFPFYGGQENIIRYQRGWHPANDTNSNGVRDYTAENGISTNRGIKYVVDTTKSWIPNEQIGYFLYDYEGSQIDSIVGNGTDSLILYSDWDSNTMVLNSGF